MSRQKPGYEESSWRQFLRKHDDIETYPQPKCLSCGNERNYCFCSHPVFKMTRGEIENGTS
jgi:hypothetical protein